MRGDLGIFSNHAELLRLFYKDEDLSPQYHLKKKDMITITGPLHPEGCSFNKIECYSWFVKEAPGDKRPCFKTSLNSFIQISNQVLDEEGEGLRTISITSPRDFWVCPIVVDVNITWKYNNG